MLDREKVETILQRRFAGATRDQAAAAVNAIMGLSDEWEEVLHEGEPVGHHFSNHCGKLCYLTADLEEGTEFRLFRRRAVATAPVTELHAKDWQ
jgi:hypothetical protein